MSDIHAVLKERGNRYGRFDEHARITQGVKDAMVTGRNWASLPPYMREALDMIAHKMGRILNGDPMYDDSWVDIVGYTQLVVDKLRYQGEYEKDGQAEPSTKLPGSTAIMQGGICITTMPPKYAPLERSPTAREIYDADRNYPLKRVPTSSDTHTWSAGGFLQPDFD